MSNGPLPLARVTLTIDDSMMERARNAAHALGVSGAAFLVNAVSRAVLEAEEHNGGAFPQRPRLPKPIAGHVREATKTPATLTTFNPVCLRAGEARR